MPYEGMAAALAGFGAEVSRVSREEGIAYKINGLTSMFTGFFSDRDVVDYETAASSDRRLYAAFFKAMLDQGVFFAPSQYEAAFLTTAHTSAVLERTVEIYRRVFRKMKKL
jgi:glutamate-1-semialdehyde 2,1-aminomutase